MTVLIEVSQLPPDETSPNSRAFWAKKYKAGKVYHDAVYYSCVNARNKGEKGGKRFPMLRARLDLTFVFAVSRRRDRDNWLSRFKPGLDAIKDASLILDDDSEHLEIGEILFWVNPEVAPLTIIRLAGYRHFRKSG